MSFKGFAVDVPKLCEECNGVPPVARRSIEGWVCRRCFNVLTEIARTATPVNVSAPAPAPAVVAPPPRACVPFTPGVGAYKPPQPQRKKRKTVPRSYKAEEDRKRKQAEGEDSEFWSILPEGSPTCRIKGCQRVPKTSGVCVHHRICLKVQEKAGNMAYQYLIKRSKLDRTEHEEKGDLHICWIVGCSSPMSLRRVCENCIRRIYNLAKKVPVDMRAEFIEDLAGPTTRGKQNSIRRPDRTAPGWFRKVRKNGAE